MGRHPENSSDLIDLKFPCLQELCFVRRDGNGRIFHALFQDGNLVAVGRTAKGGVPGITHPGGVFQRSRMLQYTAGCCSVGVELTAVLLRRDCQTDGVLRHGDRTVAYQSVKAQTRNMEYIRGGEADHPTFHGGGIVIGFSIFVVQSAVAIPVHGHTVRHQGIEGDHFTLAVSDDLCVGVAPEEQVRHEGFPEDEGAHLRVRLIVEQTIQRMVEGLLLAAIAGVSKYIQRKTGYCFGKNTDAGIDRRHLHGGALIHLFAGSRASHEKAVAAASGSVLGLVPGTE